MTRVYILNGILSLIGILIGIFISFQIFSPKVEITNTWEPISELTDTLQQLNNSHKQLQNQIGALRTKNNELEAEKSNTQLKNTLDEVKKYVGLTEVTGNGIQVTLDINNELYAKNNPDSNYCFAADLRDLINMLKAGGAEAISINNQRIISKTPIACFGSSVLINNLRFLPPYTIYAIGPDTKKMLSFLETEKYLSDFYSKITEGWIEFGYEEKESLIIPVFTGSITPNYVQ